MLGFLESGFYERELPVPSAPLYLYISASTVINCPIRIDWNGVPPYNPNRVSRPVTMAKINRQRANLQVQALRVTDEISTLQVVFNP